MSTEYCRPPRIFFGGWVGFLQNCEAMTRASIRGCHVHSSTCGMVGILQWRHPGAPADTSLMLTRPRNLLGGKDATWPAPGRTLAAVPHFEARRMQDERHSSRCMINLAWPRGSRESFATETVDRATLYWYRLETTD